MAAIKLPYRPYLIELILVALSSFIKEETEAKEIMWLAQGHTPGNEELRFQLIIFRNCKLKTKKKKKLQFFLNEWTIIVTESSNKGVAEDSRGK